MGGSMLKDNCIWERAVHWKRVSTNQQARQDVCLGRDTIAIVQLKFEMQNNNNMSKQKK